MIDVDKKNCKTIVKILTYIQLKWIQMIFLLT